VPESQSLDTVEQAPEVPAAMASPFPLGNPGDSLRLVAGSVTLGDGERAWPVQANIDLVWLPWPRFHFEIPEFTPDEQLRSHLFQSLLSPPKPVTLRLEDGTVVDRAWIRVEQLSFDGDAARARLAGRVHPGLVRPRDADVTSAAFLVPNFESPAGVPVRYVWGSSLGRQTLAGGGWEITLDNVEGTNEVLKRLKTASGYAVTQVGQLTRSDRSRFRAADLTEVLTALNWYLSFAAGRWTGPTLVQGRSSDGRPAWELWHLSRTDPFRTRTSWVVEMLDGQFPAPFPGFMSRLADEVWRDAVRLAIHWYVEANGQAGSVEGAIVLTQAAFELLASMVHDHEPGSPKVDGFDRQSAAARTRYLLDWAGIPGDIPPKFADLAGVAVREGCADAAAVLAEVRNMITHPNARRREQLGRMEFPARVQAWKLGTGMVELLLLRIFDFHGRYANRITRRYDWEADPVPWADPV
jgi:hypothetical protein